ncbi:flagellar hook-length control protein FliK [Oceanobacillus jeddahense]|uniref:flagellar hook-length control protein FliK n=1 Tax=Oceanobacillus jeddahense TaxID=1462527 RepID=UPI0036387C8F
MNAAMLNIHDLMFSNRTNAKTTTNQGSSKFGNLLTQQTEPLSLLTDRTSPLQDQEQQLTKLYENLEEMLPEEVLDILKGNDVLQEEVIDLIMQGLSSQQNVFPMEVEEQQKAFIENLVGKHLSSLKQLESAPETKADLQVTIDIYNEIAEVLKGFEKTADIDDMAGTLTELVQDWEQFFQENPGMDKERILNHIHQQMQSNDLSGFDQAINQMAYQLLDVDFSAQEMNNGEDVEAINVNNVLQGLNQFMLTIDSTTAEQFMEQIINLLAGSNLIDEGLLKNEQFETQWVKAQQLMNVISQQIQRADTDTAKQIAGQIMKQLQGVQLSEQTSVSAQQASAAGPEGKQPLEVRIATWLRSIFKEVSPGVIKQSNNINVAGHTASEVTRHIEPKLAAWLHTSFQDASPAVFKQDHLPISKVEQFIVNMGSTDSSKGLSGKELIDKIETIVQSQRLQNFARGQSPISIQLRPENLGDMTIRFLQTNGELTVQMLVSSKAVKEVLESNLHQLRNVFSPHQVTIERQETLNASQTDVSKNPKENQNEQQQAEHQEASSDSNEPEQSSETESFESFMEQLLSQNIEEQV